MKKIAIVILLIISLFSVSKINVNAEVFSANKRYDDKVKIDYLEDKGNFASCDGIFSSEAIDMIREVLNWIRIIAPILLILFIALDLSSAVMSGDNDSISKATKRIVPRMIGTVLLFFVPTIIRAILNMDGIRTAIEIPDDPLCGTMAPAPVTNNINDLI